MQNMRDRRCFNSRRDATITLQSGDAVTVLVQNPCTMPAIRQIVEAAGSCDTCIIIISERTRSIFHRNDSHPQVQSLACGQMCP